jgi:hypothetical protein
MRDRRRLARLASRGQESPWCLQLPGIRQEFAQELAINTGEGDANCGQSLAPPHLLARGGSALDCRQDSVLVEHHVHALVAPERREDLTADTKRRPAVVILLNGLGQREGNGASLVSRDGHGRNYAPARVSFRNTRRRDAGLSRPAPRCGPTPGSVVRFTQRFQSHRAGHDLDDGAHARQAREGR